MKAMQISFVVGLLLALFAVLANGFHFYGPYDVFKARAARWPAIETPSPGGADVFLNTPENQPDYYKLISYLNDVGKRRR
ncbi:unnamed protein product [Lymnaea stagnalis]|uniref:Uncharacterized protein n=1 Tax=Lymnaea stagnalis TaxID=6523 RepID=A0AAV2GY66_LYMST